MSSSSIGESLQGINWSVNRQVVYPYIAMEAGREILDAIATRDPMLLFDHEQPRSRYSAYQIEGLSSLSANKKANPNSSFDALLVVKDAIEPLKDPDIMDYDVGYINVLARGGKVPIHTDNDPRSLSFVSLLGDVEVRVKHVDEPEFSFTILRPGDSLRIINPTARRQRPRHELVNLSGFARVSFGEFTSK